MKTMSYSQSRARYAEMLDGVINDREEVVITRADHDRTCLARPGVIAQRLPRKLISPAFCTTLVWWMARCRSAPTPGCAAANWLPMPC